MSTQDHHHPPEEATATATTPSKTASRETSASTKYQLQNHIPMRRNSDLGGSEHPHAIQTSPTNQQQKHQQQQHHGQKQIALPPGVEFLPQVLSAQNPSHHNRSTSPSNTNPRNSMEAEEMHDLDANDVHNNSNFSASSQDGAGGVLTPTRGSRDDTVGGDTVVVPRGRRGSVLFSVTSEGRRGHYDNNNNTNNNPQNKDKKERGGKHTNKLLLALTRPSLRSIIAVACGLVILIVAIVTVALSSVVAGQTVRSLGEQLSRSFVISAQNKAEAYFEEPVKHISAVAAMMKEDGVRDPVDDPNLPLELFCAPFRSILIASNYSYPTIGSFFQKSGNLFGALVFKRYNMVGCGLRNNFNVSNNGGFVVNTMAFYYLSNNSRVPDHLAPTDTSLSTNSIDSRGTAYYGMAPIASRSKDVYALNVVAYTGDHIEVSLNVPFFTGMYNASDHFLGIIALSLPSDSLQRFFAEIEKTENSHFIAIDGSGTILASTYSASIAETYFQSSSLPVPQGCLTSNDVLPATDPGIVCSQTTSTYPYPPLRQLASSGGNSAARLLTPTQLEFQAMDVDGQEYFVVSSPIPNSARRFVITILFFLPTDDILADIRAGRNLTMGIAACIFVLAVLLSVLFVFRLLVPLDDILKVMTAAARLQIDEESFASRQQQQEQEQEELENGENSNRERNKNITNNPSSNLSSIAEMYELQLAMRNMTSALLSFTRYLPVEIVKDIAESGTLCKIGMSPRDCTSLFVDIAGFTSISERVPTNDLSLCMTIFYEQMTQCLTKTSGQMITLLGDGLFAIFSAPSYVPNHELKGALCALMMSRETVVDPIAAAFDDVGEQLNLRLGVNSGTANVGNQGCSSRLMWTAVGDSINVSSRLEGLNKAFGTRVMISDVVASKCKDILALRLLMPVKVVGKDESVKVYEVCGVLPNIHPSANNLPPGLDGNEVRQVTSESMFSAGSLFTQNSSQESPSMDLDGGYNNNNNLANSSSSGNNKKNSSRRKVNKKSVQELLKSVLSEKEATLYVSNVEMNFINDFNACAELFAEGQAQPCLGGLKQLREAYPAFYSPDGSIDALKLQIKKETEKPLISLVEGAGSVSGGTAGSTNNSTNNTNANLINSLENLRNTSDAIIMIMKDSQDESSSSYQSGTNNRHNNSNAENNFIKLSNNNRRSSAAEPVPFFVSRCEAGLIRAELSTQRMEIICQRVLEEQQERNNKLRRGEQVFEDSDGLISPFVYRADTK